MNFLIEPADAKTCREASDCHQNAHCVVRENSLDYFCECLPGYRGDGVTRCTAAGLIDLKMRDNAGFFFATVYLSRDLIILNSFPMCSFLGYIC